MNYKIKHIILIIVLVILQIVWFNHTLLFGKIQPLIYIYAVLWLPLHKNESTNLLIGFLIGLIIDFFLNTGGVFAATTVWIVYLRKYYFMFVKTQSQSIENITIEKLDFGNKLLYYSVFIFVTILSIYWLESFNIKLVILKLPIILANTLGSLFFILFIDYFFVQTKER